MKKPDKSKQAVPWQKQNTNTDYETIFCETFDPFRDFILDPTGFYVLVRVSFSEYCIEVAICDDKHRVIKVFKGRAPQEIYSAIFKYEKDHQLEWFQEKTHIAYLGKELKKAEVALSLGNSAYYQE